MRFSTTLSNATTYLYRFYPIWVGLFLLWLWFIYSNSAIGLHYESFIISVLFGFVLYKQIKKRTATWGLSATDIVLGIGVLYVGMRLVNTPLPQFAADKFLQALSLLFIFMFMRQQVRGRKQAEIWETSLITIILLLAVLEFISLYLLFARWSEISADLAAPPQVGFRLLGIILPGANFTAALLNLALPLVLVRLLVSAGRKKVLWAGLLGLIMVIEFFASSRTSWGAGLAAAVTTLALYYWPSLREMRRTTKLRAPRVSARRLVIAAAGLGALAMMTALMAWQVQRTPGHRGLLSGRETIWANAWDIWANHLMIGGGTGSFPLNYALVADLPPGWLPDTAHNMWLHIGAEYGIIGLALVCAFALTVGFTLFRAWKNNLADHRYRGHLSAFLGIWVAVLVQQQADFHFHIPLYGGYVLVLVCLALYYAQPRLFQIRNRFVYAGLIGLAAIYLWGSVFTSRGLAGHIEADIAYEDQQVGVAEQRLCAAAELAPEFSVYSFQCAALAAELFSKERDPAKLDAAIEATRRGLSVDPYWPIHWSNLAILEWARGNHGEAFRAIRQAHEEAPQNALLAINYAWMAEQLNMDTLAATLYETALDLDPWLRESPYFQETELRREAGSAAPGSTANALSAEIVAVYQTMVAGDYANAAERLELLRENNPRHPEIVALLALTELKQGDPNEQARPLAQAAVLFDIQRRLEDQNPRVYLWAGLVAQEQGRYERAAGLFRQSVTLWGLKTQYDSAHFYYAVYHRPFGIRSFVPGYQRADYLPEMMDAFVWLADYYERHGNHASAEEVRFWLDSEGGFND